VLNVRACFPVVGGEARPTPRSAFASVARRELVEWEDLLAGTAGLRL
jgi:hypothetical protein